MILHESDSRAQCDFAPEIAAHSGDESVVYKRVGQEPLYLSLYFPPHGGQDGMRPILLLVHGGGWRGKKVFPEQPHWMGDYLGFLARYYAEQGYFCASIDYRLLVENRYTRARIFTGGRQNSDSAYQYTIFVHKDDLDRARGCLSQDYRSIP